MFNHFVALGSAVSNRSRKIIANYWRRRISVCFQSGVANAINTRSNRLTARTHTAGPHIISQGESFYPGLVEKQAEAFRDGSLIAWGDEIDNGEGWGTVGAGGGGCVYVFEKNGIELLGMGRDPHNFTESFFKEVQIVQLGVSFY